MNSPERCFHEFGLAGECLRCHAVEQFIFPKGTHSDLVAALEAILRNWGSGLLLSGEVVEQGKRALRKAKGEGVCCSTEGEGLMIERGTMITGVLALTVWGAIFLDYALPRWSAPDVSEAYRCGVMRALRDREGMGPTETETEARCTQLQRAGWDAFDKNLADCLTTVGAGNYHDPDHPPPADGQEACFKATRKVRD